MFRNTIRWRVLLFVWFACGWGVVAQGGVVTFLNDYEGFLAAAGNVRTIDFETLPDGSPSHVGVHITSAFNYTSQGVTFSSPTGDPFIAGNPVSGFELAADGYYQQQRTWIVADLNPPALAVGVFFAGGMYLSAYDSDDDLIAEAHFGDAGAPWFVGIVSDTPIARAIADQHDRVSFSAEILEFQYVSIPEPGSLFLLLATSVALVRKRPNM